MEVTRGWERENGELAFNGDRVSVWGEEKVLETEVLTEQYCE